MRQDHLLPVWTRQFVHATDSKYALPIPPNVLDRQSNATQPNQAWVAAISHIGIRTRWLYPAMLPDLFVRKAVGWATTPNMLRPRAKSSTTPSALTTACVCTPN